MNKIVCEMCGGNDLLKQDGVFICQNCGCKYTIEEAKKMMIEGTVSVTGTVAIDSTNELNNLFELARRAKNEGNNENALKYYEQIVLKNPNSWEAYFFSIYYKSMKCKIGEIYSAAMNVANCIEVTFKLIKDYVDNFEEKKTAISTISLCANQISVLLRQASDSFHYSLDISIRSSHTNQSISEIAAIGSIKQSVCDGICNIFENDEDIMRAVGIDILKARIDEGIFAEPAKMYETIIRKYEPTYEMHENQLSQEYVMKSLAEFSESCKNNNNNSGGCYIATAVYGTYDCPEVWTLRRFRDYSLALSWYGRAFIHIYYAISPKLVKWFGHKKWFVYIWKKKLDKMILKLQKDGFEDTPYEDRKW